MINNYKKFTESVEGSMSDDRDHYDTDGMEHITYLLRITLRNRGIEDFSVDFTGYDICISVFCYELERLKDMINIFDVLQNIKTDIIPQYDSEFDMYQTRKGDTVLEFNFLYNDENN